MLVKKERKKERKKESKDDIDIKWPQMNMRSRANVKMNSNFTSFMKVNDSPSDSGLRLWD